MCLNKKLEMDIKNINLQIHTNTYKSTDITLNVKMIWLTRIKFIKPQNKKFPKKYY